MYALGMALEKIMLEGFIDSHMSGDVESNQSTSGYVMTYAGGAMSWKSRLQKVMALSTTEVVHEARKKLIWMRNFLSELGMKQEDFPLHCNNQNTIHLAKNVAYRSHTRHI